MSSALAQAGQFLISTARAVAPTVASVAATTATTAAQNLILGPIKARQQGPRREEIRIQTASEGVGIARLYGRQRIAGQIIWVTNFKETTEVTTTSQGGKGVRRSQELEYTEYLYSVSLAIGLCEGEISRIGRVWADGKTISLQDYNYRLYHGTEDQTPDALIELMEGTGNAPAYRGLAYIVFEDLPLASFGNRVPQFNFEVERPLATEDPDSLEQLTEAVTLIPASGESVYHTDPVMVEEGEGVTRAENVFNNVGGTDFQASMEHLTTALPNTEAVELIVSWFGTDLRVGNCKIEPRVEVKDKTQLPEDWSVAGLTRASANEVSQSAPGALAYGGTPSDLGVRQAIRDMKSRGLKVVFYPFILMDVPPGSGLPDPYGGAEQAPYPWRGRITCYPRETVDKTATARAQVDAFFAEYRPMILHYAQLCAEEGGVEAFLIGSEMRELTNIRDEQNRFPAVEHFITLAADVKAILGPTVKVSYAADWSEYSNYRPNDGSGDVYFHLDPLWASSDIDFIGIDNYMPLSDWRAGAAHLDALAGAASIYQQDYLLSNIRGGEGYDWFYANQTDRDAQTRTPISDTAHGEDWVFRYKDLWSWWSSAHHDRPGGVRSSTSTGWAPQSKPFWFTELGCSATDKGSNQPNIFFDPKSSESGRPYYSNGNRDDMIQRRFLEAHLSYWEDTGNNPISPVYSGPMVEKNRIFLYTWDARPFPDFPVRQTVWTDAENWIYGQWLNGRAGRVPLGQMIEDIAAKSGLLNVDASACQTLVTGYLIPGLMAARDAMEPLFELYQLDAVERAGVLIVTPRSGEPVAAIDYDDLVLDGPDVLSISRAQETDLPKGFSLIYTDGLSDYQTATADVDDPSARSDRRSVLDTAIVLEAGEAEGRASALLAAGRAMRTTAQFGLSPDEITLEPSDVVTVSDGGRDYTLRLVNILDGPYREVQAVKTDAGLYLPRYTGLSADIAAAPAVAGPVALAVMDLPIIPDGEDGAFLHVAAFAQPWPGRVAVYRGEGVDATPIGTISSLSTMGRLTQPLAAGPTSRWDEGTRIRVKLSAGGLSSLDPTAVLNGAGRAAVETSPGAWEILGYRDAVLEPDGTWTLSGLLRGLRGTEGETLAGAPADARIVFLNDGRVVEPLSADLFGATEVWQAGPASKAPGIFPYREQDVTLVGTGARPFAPVHVNAEAQGAQLAVSWIRRTRIGGDNWSVPEVPLGETAESYRVTTYDGVGGVLETQTVSSSTASVAAAGVATVAVEQISSLYGPGRAAQIGI